MLARGLKFAALAMACLVVAACARTFESDVVSFHQLPKPAGETFKIVAKDEEKQGSLELEQYAGLIRAKLSDLGYRAVADDADLLVKVDYGIDGGRERVRSRPGAFGPGPYSFYGFNRGFLGGYNYGFGGGFGNDVYSYPVFTRRLEMDIASADGESLFEGRAISEGRDNRLPEVMPYLVQAMFANFPGESGVTKVVKIEEDGRKGNY